MSILRQVKIVVIASVVSSYCTFTLCACTPFRGDAHVLNCDSSFRFKWAAEFTPVHTADGVWRSVFSGVPGGNFVIAIGAPLEDAQKYGRQFEGVSLEITDTYGGVLVLCNELTNSVETEFVNSPNLAEWYFEHLLGCRPDRWRIRSDTTYTMSVRAAADRPLPTMKIRLMVLRPYGMTF
jgi:uncharacterized lipoprotein YehR (DUF1307 family)